MCRSVMIILVTSLGVLGFATTASASTLTTGFGVRLSASDVIVLVAFKCEMVEGKLVCGSTKGNKDRDENDDDDNDKPKKSKDKVIPKTCGKKVNCEAGFVKLEKPNKYGACCEAREGLPPAKQQEGEKCKFPGEVGTQPNCTCPSGTEFLGFRGCVKWTKQRVNCEVLPNKPGAYVRQDFWEQKECFPRYGKDKTRGSCLSYQGSTQQLECCCEVKVYEK